MITSHLPQKVVGNSFSMTFVSIDPGLLTRLLPLVAIAVTWLVASVRRAVR
jgi:hypothetical protein